jgi:FkbM family methyltransferase
MIRDRIIRTQVFQVAKGPIISVLHRLGYEVRRTGSTTETLKRRLLASEAVDLLVDVGANQGQYARHARFMGYGGEMISFEPGANAFRLLARSAATDSNWTTVRAAVGAINDSVMLNVSANSVSSSLLPVSDLHTRAERASETIASESVPIVTLDEHIAAYGEGKRIWLKLDVQGYEGEVLKGATKILRQCCVMECEASVRELYGGGIDYLSLLQLIHDEGFTLVWLEPGFTDQLTGEILQFDFIAARR